jgi:hypothetical protein
LVGTIDALAQAERSPFDGRWSATVGPQGGCNFTSLLTIEVVGSSLVGNATNPLGVFPLTGTVDPSGRGVFKIGAYAGTIRFSSTTFEANYANNCGGRFAVGREQLGPQQPADIPTGAPTEYPGKQRPDAIGTASEASVCSNPAAFDGQNVTLDGTVTDLKEKRSRKGNDYTTFKLQDCGAISIFTWGHPTISNGDHVRVEGEFETDRHKGPNRFPNDLEATKISPLSH